MLTDNVLITGLPNTVTDDIILVRVVYRIT